MTPEASLVAPRQTRARTTTAWCAWRGLAHVHCVPLAGELPGPDGWSVGVQWHPEDTAAVGPGHAAWFRAFVTAARDGVAV